jgi:hypothetical protein
MTARAATATTTASRLIIKVDTLNSTVLPTDVTPDPDPGEPAKQRHPWRWLSALIGLVLVGIVASPPSISRITYTPGAATDTGRHQDRRRAVLSV